MAIPISELQAVAPSAILEFFQLDLNAVQHGVTETYRFHAGTSLNSNSDLVWAGNTYIRFPIEADGFEYNGKGTLPRPRIRCSNILGTITAILVTLPNGLEGAKVTRIRTLARYLDAVNFPGAVNPYGTPDPTAEFPQEIYYIDRKSNETRDVVEFELASAFDLVGVRAPRRQCLRNLCPWTYKGSDCGWDPVGDPLRYTQLHVHYRTHGYSEGRVINASGQFDAAWYLAAYADVAAAGYTLLTANEHYRTYGLLENRDGNAGGIFDSAYYLTTYPDLGVLVYFDENDQGTVDPAQDVCGKRLSSCVARFGYDSIWGIPFGAFPGIGTYFA